LLVASFRNHHGSVLLLVLMVHIHTGLDQEVHCLLLPTPHRIIERGLAIIVDLVTFSAIELENLTDHSVAFSGSIEDGGLAISVHMVGFAAMLDEKVD